MRDALAGAKVGRPITEQDVFDLLRIGRRIERLAVVRMVKQVKDRCRRGHRVEPHTRQASSLCDMYQMACDDLLAAIKVQR